ncbi:MAG: YihY/virulence factor BrkB family protein [Thermoleophilia bacterium]|nr:YihY/virulence factor BrkB family protein [Thermoleophilia bacterium]
MAGFAPPPPRDNETVAVDSSRSGRSPSWYAALKRTLREFREDNLTDWAAALTYYGVLSIFPALVVLVALLGLFGEHPRTTDALLGIVRDVSPGATADTLRDPIVQIVQSKGGAGALLGVGLLGALWSASGYIGAFTRAMNVIYEVREGRPFWKLRPLQTVVTAVMVLLLAIVAVAIVVTGPLADAVGGAIGLGDGLVTAWNYGKWPVLVAIVALMIALLYYVTPNVRQPRFRLVTPGAVVAVVVWLLASGAFALYVANFGSYNKTYGSLGAVVVFLVWLWLSNAAILLGAELDAERERERQLAAGESRAAEELQLPPRDPPN